MVIPIRSLAGKRAILQAFGHERDPATCYHEYPEEFYLENLAAVQAGIPFRKPKQNEALSRFLYAGCLRFGRWFAPSPYIIHEHLADRFSQFVRALWKAEGGSSDNTAVFELHTVRSSLYREYDSEPIETVPPESLAKFRKVIRRLRLPNDYTKGREFVEQRDELLQIVQGLEDHSLRTVIRTRLPYIIHKSNLNARAVYEGIAVEVVASPSFHQPGDSFVMADPHAISVGASRWQGGITTVEITAAALIDIDWETPSLQSIDGEKTPISGWPQGFSFVFRLLHELVWRLRIHHDGERQWIPSPRDLAEIEAFLRTRDTPKLSWKVKGSPAALFEVFTKPTADLTLDLGVLEPVPWSTRCRSLSRMYLELGETNEAMFWLNVGVEALFKERFARIAMEIERPELESELNSPKAFWAPAEEVVVNQFPEMAGKVQWPEGEVHVSVYAKLRFLYREVPMRTSIKELLHHYRAVSLTRNALFHGVRDTRLPVSEVEVAFSSFDWIVDNMHTVAPGTA